MTGYCMGCKGLVGSNQIEEIQKQKKDVRMFRQCPTVYGVMS